MKPESLKVSGPEVLTPISSEDFVTQVLHHPEILALCHNGNPSPRVKAIALIAGQVKEEQIYERQRRAAPERLFKLAFLQRMFGSSASPVIVQAGSEEPKPRAIWDHLNVGVLLPVLIALTLALAAWKNSEVSSWKSTSEANKELVSVVKQQLDGAQDNIKSLTQKNDDLQNDVKDALKSMSEQNADLAATKQKLIDALNKGKSQSPVKPTSQVSTQPDPGNKP
jgi:hypothetical protein